MQRMLPSTSSSESVPSPTPIKDTRAFQYRFSMVYVRALPESQRPVEREVFGMSSLPVFISKADYIQVHLL